MENAKTKFEAAVQAEKAGDSDEAIRLYEESLLLDPKFPDPKVRLAMLLHEVGKWKESIRVARQLIKRWPRFQPAYVLIATSHFRLGRLKIAERFYRQALAIKEDTNVFALHGGVLYELERMDEAQECFHKALELDPDNEGAHWNLGRIYRETGKSDAAEKHLKRAIEIDPKLGRAYAELGNLLAGQKNRLKEATSVLRRAVKYNPDDGWSLAFLADALSRLGKQKAAEEQYRRLIELWPNSPMSNWLYGDFLASKRKNRLGAEWYLRKAVKIEPKNEFANYFLGRRLVLWDRNEEAREFLAKAARKGHAKAREWLQWIRDNDDNVASK